MSYNMGIVIQRCVQGEMVACEVRKNFRQEAVLKFILEEWINNSQVDKGVRASRILCKDKEVWNSKT